jgi:hypothetical protein
VLSAAVVAFYTDSVNGTAKKLKQVTAKAGERTLAKGRGGAPHSSRTPRGRDDGPAGEGGSPLEATADAERFGADGVSADGPGEHGVDGGAGTAPSVGRRIARIAAMSVVIGLIGIAAVFGIQRLTGTELSPGTGQIQRSVTGTESVTPRGDTGGTTEDGTGQQDGTGQDGGTDSTEQGTTEDTTEQGTSEQDTTEQGTTEQEGTTGEGGTGEGTSTGGTTDQGEGSSSEGGSSGTSGSSGASGTSGTSSSSGEGDTSGTASSSGTSGSSGTGSSSGTGASADEGSEATDPVD